MKFKIFAQVIILMVLWAGCTDPPRYQDEPRIEFVSITRTFIAAGDSVTIRFRFEDGDGDLGGNVSGSCGECDSTCLLEQPWDIYLTDLRTDCGKLFNLPEFPDGGSTDDISGEIVLTPFLFCRPLPVGLAYDTVELAIQIQDRSGKMSNVTFVTTPIVIDCGL